MKRFVRSLVLLVLAMVGGCSTITGDGRTVVRVATWGGAGDDSEFAKVEREIFAEFERQNPDIDIRLELIPGSQEYVRKMLLNFIARSEPEVMLLDASSAAVFVDNGVLKDLTPIIAKDQSFDLDAYFPNVVDIARRGDQVYAIPKDFTPMVLYYNRRLFDAAGVGYPKDHWTYEEFLDAAKRRTDPRACTGSNSPTGCPDGSHGSGMRAATC
ncbi:MAG: extracellular solute-binding protein [Fimbriimonadaceae bacterium]|nr:extracellular solute-binding protein [Fimbriimonadaceae bacterium]